MMTAIRQWLASLNEGERDLNSQGYIIVYGAAGSFVVPVDSDRPLPGGRRIPLWELHQLQPA
jgi:hypothetical protein